MWRFLVFILLLLIPLKAYALDISLPNNKFGIHLAVPNIDDIQKAAELVNSSGGKWGYVTLVIEEDDRNHDKWQEIFNQMRRLHLIPIVRVATVPEGAVWKRPVKEDADSWATFLNGLNWPVKDRYVILFNEPNHVAEWGGTVDPANYGEVAAAFVDSLTARNGDFFVMLAGLDASAPNGSSTVDEGTFLSQMAAAQPEIFDKVEGWSSHSYPNPGFSGSPGASGRGTIRGYEWELNYLRSLGVTKDLPVFITETGWSNASVTLEQIGQNLISAFVLWGSDSRVRAVTPFVLNYQGEPFLQFSWKKYLSEEFFPQFEVVKNLPKLPGDPEQIDKGIVTANLPHDLLIDSNYRFFIPLRNEGQAIWDKDDGYTFKLETTAFESSFLSELDDIEPQEDGDVELFLKTRGETGKGQAVLGLYKDAKKILDGGTWQFNILPLPSLDIKVKAFPKGNFDADHLELQIFDEQEQLVYKKRNVRIRNGAATVDSIHNVYLGGRYRVVLLNNYYLPRQTYVTFGKIGNAAQFKVFLPLDFNLDGTFNLKDLGVIVTHPSLFGLFLP